MSLHDALLCFVLVFHAIPSARSSVSNMPTTSGIHLHSELWRQARGLAIRNKFPKYTATLDEKDDGKPAAVVVKYVDGRIQRINAAHLILLDVFDQMAEFTEALLVAEELAELDKS